MEAGPLRQADPRSQPTPPPAWRKPPRQKTEGRAKARSVCMTLSWFWDSGGRRRNSQAVLMQYLIGPQFQTLLVAPRSVRRANRAASSWRFRDARFRAGTA